MAAKEGTTTDGLPSKGMVEKKPAEKEGDEGGLYCAIFTVIVLAIIGVVHLFIDVAHITRHMRPPRLFGPYDPVKYTVAIAAATGLNDLHEGRLLDPAFNLTLAVASPRTAERRECVKPGTTVEVSYLRSGVPLAAGPAPAFCVGVGERWEEASVVAWGVGVRLPGLVLDSLAADVRRGAAEFGVKLVPLPDCEGGERFCYGTVDVVSCWAKVGGGFSAPCNVSEERVSFPPAPRPGVKDDSAAANLLPQPPTP